MLEVLSQGSFLVLLSAAVNFLATDRLNLLKVQGLDESEELVFRLFQFVIYKSVGEENRVVCQLNLFDCLLDSHFEFLLSLDSVSNSLSQLLERWWIDEEEIALKSLLVDLNGSLNIDFDDWNLSIGLDSLQF